MAFTRLPRDARERHAIIADWIGDFVRGSEAQLTVWEHDEKHPVDPDKPDESEFMDLSEDYEE